MGGRLRTWFPLAVLLLLCAWSALAAAYQPEPEKETITQWEFGVEVISVGQARGIVAAFPVPIEWPEQAISLGANDQTDNVGAVEFLDLGSARMAVLRIAQLAPNESARVVIPVRVTKRPQVAPTDTAQWAFAETRDKSLRPYLRPSPQIESNHKKIKDLVKTAFVDDANQSPWQQVESIYDWVRDEIEYQFEETNRSCLEALATKKGDCGEMTGLFIALCRAKGIPARAVWVPQHTYPEFYLVDANGNGTWFPCQIAGDYQFGSIYEPKPILQKGDQFKLPGQSKALRYVQPTLTADDAPDGLQIRWITRPVDQK
jgi:transglutaminase-like putative cysteine protease